MAKKLVAFKLCFEGYVIDVEQDLKSQHLNALWLHRSHYSATGTDLVLPPFSLHGFQERNPWFSSRPIYPPRRQSQFRKTLLTTEKMTLSPVPLSASCQKRLRSRWAVFAIILAESHHFPSSFWQNPARSFGPTDNTKALSIFCSSKGSISLSFLKRTDPLFFPMGIWALRFPLTINVKAAFPLQVRLPGATTVKNQRPSAYRNSLFLTAKFKIISEPKFINQLFMELVKFINRISSNSVIIMFIFESTSFSLFMYSWHTWSIA